MKKRAFFKLGLGIALLLAVLVVLPLLLPLDYLAPRIAHEASIRLGLPVKLAGLRLQVLPTPRLVLSGVEVGKGELGIDSIALVPALDSLFSPVRVLRLIEAKGVRVRDLPPIGRTILK